MKICLNSYERVPFYSEIAETRADWKSEFAKDEYYLAIITKKDKVYSHYKYDRKTNYKSGILNSLGVFEHP